MIYPKQVSSLAAAAPAAAAPAAAALAAAAPAAASATAALDVPAAVAAPAAASLPLHFKPYTTIYICIYMHKYIYIYSRKKAGKLSSFYSVVC